MPATLKFKAKTCHNRETTVDPETAKRGLHYPKCNPKRTDAYSLRQNIHKLAKVTSECPMKE